MWLLGCGWCSPSQYSNRATTSLSQSCAPPVRCTIARMVGGGCGRYVWEAADPGLLFVYTAPSYVSTNARHQGPGGGDHAVHIHFGALHSGYCCIWCLAAQLGCQTGSACYEDASRSRMSSGTRVCSFLPDKGLTGSCTSIQAFTDAHLSAPEINGDSDHALATTVYLKPQPTFVCIALRQYNNWGFFYSGGIHPSLDGQPYFSLRHRVSVEYSTYVPAATFMQTLSRRSWSHHWESKGHLLPCSHSQIGMMAVE